MNRAQTFVVYTTVITIVRALHGHHARGPVKHAHGMKCTLHINMYMSVYSHLYACESARV